MPKEEESIVSEEFDRKNKPKTEEDVKIDKINIQEYEDMKRKFKSEYPPKEAKSSAPTYTPKSFNEQFYLYENSGTQRLYVYIDDGWHYINLT